MVKKKEKKINRKTFFKESNSFVKEGIFNFIEAYNPAFMKKIIKGNKIPTKNLYPPGAIKEPLYSKKCTACNLCVEACPYGSIKLLENNDGKMIAMINPYQTPCYLCADISCSKSCPEGALLPLEDRMDIKIGFAAPTFHCRNQKEKDRVCTICQDVCPFMGDCIKFNIANIPMIKKNVCNGCGICANNCPELGKGLIIFPR